MPKILITGSGSFIGRNYIRHSVFKSVDEVSVQGIDPGEIRFEGYNIIIHLAAIVHQSDKKDKEEYFKINRDLCVEIARNAKRAGVGQFIFLSSIKVYGEFGNRSEPWNENSECNPTDYYGKSKLEAEQALKKLETKDFVVSIIRTPVVYGEGVKANILSLIKLVERVPVLPLAGINNCRNYTFVENLVAFIDRIIEKKASGTFIIMDNDHLSTTELVENIASGLGKKTILFRLPSFIVNFGLRMFPQYFDRLYGSLILDNTLTKSLLQYDPPYDIKTGLRKMMIYYQKGPSPVSEVLTSNPPNNK